MRRLAWFSAGFGAACLLASYGLGGLRAAAGAASLCLAALAFWLRSRARSGEFVVPARFPARRRRVFAVSRRAVALLLGAALAFLWSAAYAGLFRDPALALVGDDRAVCATVRTAPTATSIGGWSMVVRLEEGPDVLLYGGPDWGEVRPGDRVRCTARLRPADNLYGEETTYYTARGVYLLGYCNDPPETERPDTPPLSCWPALCAQALRRGVYAAFDGDIAPLAAAITLGDKSGLDENLYAALNRSGMMHAAVVSGMHITFLWGMLSHLFPGRRRVALCVIPILLFYALMAGGTPSAIRAVVMQGALLAAPVLRREDDPPTALGLALLILLLRNPFAVAGAGLQLSFASVAGMLLAGPGLYRVFARPLRALRKREGLSARLLARAGRFVAASLSVSLSAMLFTTPLIALYFGQILLVGPLCSMLVLQVVSWLLPAALVVGTLGIFLPAAAWVFGIIAGLLGYYIRWVVLTVGEWPFAALDAGNRCFQIWLGAAYLYLPALVPPHRRGRRLIAGAVCLALLLAVGVGLNRRAVDRADLTVAALDVGQGASALLLTGERCALVDCGGSASRSAGDIAADRLASMGRTRLDLLVFTHLDADHFNGAARLFRRLRVAAVAVPATERDRPEFAALEAMVAAEGAELVLIDETRQEFGLGSAVLTLYPPLGAGTSNEEGLFALCSVGDFDVLITGDADAFVERMLIKYYGLPDVELLLAGHHGSAGSTCGELLDALRPELAVISVGYNSYGHPAPEVLDRLARAGAEVYRTDLDGTVTVTLSGGLVAIN